MPRKPAAGTHKPRKTLVKKTKSSSEPEQRSVYKTVTKALSRVLGDPRGPMGHTGSAIGSFFGMPNLGRIAGNIVGKITGTGDYVNNSQKLKYNSLFNRASDGVQIPSFANDDRSTRVVHREYIGDLISGPTGAPTLFNTWENLSVNPGLLNSFAWLSQIASNYDSYKFHGLVFEYKSMSGAATGSNTALGNIIFSAQYNSANPPFTNKLEMENYEGALSCNPSQNLLFGIECNSKDLPMDHLYIRSGQVPNGQTRQVYDQCVLQICTQAIPTANQVLGEVWCSYDVELFQPKLFSGQVGNSILTANFNSTSASVAPGTANSAFIGMVEASGNTLDVQLGYDGNGNGTITLNENLVTGKYMMTYHIGGTDAVCAPASCDLTNAIAWPIFGTAALPNAQLDSGIGTYGRYFQILVFEIDNDNAQPVVITINGTDVHTPTTPTQSSLTLTQISGLMTKVV